MMRDEREVDVRDESQRDMLLFDVRFEKKAQDARSMLSGWHARGFPSLSAVPKEWTVLAEAEARGRQLVIAVKDLPERSQVLVGKRGSLQQAALTVCEAWMVASVAREASQGRKYIPGLEPSSDRP